jgi:hypothetical protein
MTAPAAWLRGASSVDTTTRMSPMSALGQKQTFEAFIAMSALPPKADIGSALCDATCAHAGAPLA